MKKRKLFVQAVCVLLAFLMILSIVVMVVSPSAYAASSSEIQEELDELNGQKSDIQERMDNIEAEISSLDYEKANTLEKKLMLDQKNLLAQQELDVIQEQIDIIDNLIANVQSDLTDAREEEEYQRERWLSRVRAMEESSGVSYLEVVFNATSFSDLLTRLDLVNEVVAYDEQLEADYIAARENVESLEAEAETMFTENEARRQEQETKKAQLEADIEAACQLMAQMDTDIDDYNSVLEQEAATQAEIEALIVEKEEELQEAKAAEEAARQAALAAQLAAQQAQQQAQQQQQQSDTEGGSAPAVTVSGSTWMKWPSYTTNLTSRYGYRYLALYGYTRLHAGVDVGASYGSAIWSAAGGTVIQAGWNGGYGNCVMVNHGNGYTTLYGHMSSVAVSSGQSVSMGQVLGYVGSTGNSTGPHLHFEVRASATGGTIDPMSFTYF